MAASVPARNVRRIVSTWSVNLARSENPTSGGVGEFVRVLDDRFGSSDRKACEAAESRTRILLVRVLPRHRSRHAAVWRSHRAEQGEQIHQTGSSGTSSR